MLQKTPSVAGEVLLKNEVSVPLNAHAATKYRSGIALAGLDLMSTMQHKNVQCMCVHLERTPSAFYCGYNK